MKIIEKSPYDPDAICLIEELSECLKTVTGSSGQASFHPEDVCIPGSLFVIAYNEAGEAVGCGGFRSAGDNIGEVKRMYARTESVGVGTAILTYLEKQAQKFGYTSLILETRLINKRAVAFYESRGYKRIPNYGIYIERPEAVCYKKVF